MEEDWGKKLEGLLSDPDSLAKIGEMMAALSADNTPAPPPTQNSGGDGVDLSALSSLLPLLSSMGDDSRETALLKALRPYLHGAREKRLDESVKMMQLLKFLPLLQQKGLF